MKTLMHIKVQQSVSFGENDFGTINWYPKFVVEVEVPVAIAIAVAIYTFW